MTLKEELEVLYGGSISVFDGDPIDIPCIETSDAYKLCKDPVVSVHMITYNHEPYIRQAIESVVTQKVDFEFELVIGEDCSTDKTREICFEYQKKYPDKIRVLWWHENLYKINGNDFRTSAHCRGEFIAFCEGDDYWIDPLKLQKQVDIMRGNQSVGLCFCGARTYNSAINTWSVWNSNRNGFRPGFISRRQYMLWTMFGKNPEKGWGNEFWQMTATIMVRSSVLKEAMRRYDIFSWLLNVGDSTLCLGVGTLSDVYYIEDEVAVYRQTITGQTQSNRAQCGRDTLLIRLYFFRTCYNLGWQDVPPRVLEELIYCSVVSRMQENGGEFGLSEYIKTLKSAKVFDSYISKYGIKLTILQAKFRMKGHFIVSMLCWRIKNMFLSHKITKALRDEYIDCTL